MRFRCTIKLFMALAMLVFGVHSVTAQDYDKVEIASTELGDSLYMLQGWGGNIAYLTGDDGVFMVDSQMAPLTEKITTAIAKTSKEKIRFLVNTHWHFDHVDGNENFGKQGVTIIAHDNQRKRISTDQAGVLSAEITPALPYIALPTITFSDAITFHMNGEEIYVFHIAKSHTDGDAVVFFKKANVLHTGDIYFEGLYPFIDVAAQGSAAGMASAGRQILSMIDKNTKIVPGHGPLSNKATFLEYIKMLEELNAKISKYITKGKSLEEIQALNPTKSYDEKWGKGFLPANEFVRLVFEGIKINN